LITEGIHRDLDEALPLTPEAVGHYREHGYVKLKHVLAAETLANFAGVISDEVSRLNTESRPMEERSTYERAFLQIMNIWTKSDAVREFSFSRKLARIAAELMGVDGVRMYHDQALYKESGGGHTPWHADQYYWPLSSANACTVWVPLQATPLEMGPLAFSVDSHKFNVGRELEISDDSEVRISKTILEKHLTLDETPYDLGEVSYHGGWNFHRAGSNRSDRPRRAMTVIYIEDGMRLVEPSNKNQINDWNTWMPGARIGEVINTPFNPILYRA
jgi:ectoine hydroxylase-related dioxygenase (phytanoyl-CoA dioxygenase family)